MFSLRAYLENPFGKDCFKNLFSRSARLSKNKFIEFEMTYHSRTILDLNFSWTTKRDHAGLEITIGLLFFSVSLRVYDHRHWDYKNNRWENDS